MCVYLNDNELCFICTGHTKQEWKKKKLRPTHVNTINCTLRNVVLKFCVDGRVD